MKLKLNSDEVHAAICALYSGNVGAKKGDTVRVRMGVEGGEFYAEIIFPDPTPGE